MILGYGIHKNLAIIHRAQLKEKYATLLGLNMFKESRPDMYLRATRKIKDLGQIGLFPIVRTNHMEELTIKEVNP